MAKETICCVKDPCKGVFKTMLCVYDGDFHRNS